MTRAWIRPAVVSVVCVCLPCVAAAEVTSVTITSRAVVANGESFGVTGPYEKLTGRIEFALDPGNARNKAIVDLSHAATQADHRVHFTADLYVLRPVDASRGNGTLLFEIANRGRKGLLGRFNRARASQDPTAAGDFGDGFLMKEGYTLVWVGWQFDVAPPLLRVEAPVADVSGRARISFIPDARSTSIRPADFPDYPPVVSDDPKATLTVRDRFWQRATTIVRKAWHLSVVNEKVTIVLDAGFQPGRIYEVEYAAGGDRVAGVGLAAIRDAASAFRYRSDMPVRGRAAYVFGISQSGRFLRQFLHDGFNVDERDRRVFDAVWPHIAGAGQGAFNERFALPGYSSFPATRFPFTDLKQSNGRGLTDGLLARYQPDQLPKIFYTNTSVEYWGQGRAAALIHTTLDGTADAMVPENVRIYLLAGTQHGEAAFPPTPGTGQALGNPTPQANTMRALLRALHQWVSTGVAPPDSRHPRLADGTLVPVKDVLFPTIPGIRDPRSIEGPAEMAKGRVAPLPFLVPRVDADGNEVAGIRTPDVSVPLATTTGWNFRAERVGNPSTIYPLLGSYVPFPRTRAERDARIDPRLSIEERYRGRDDYLSRVRHAAEELIQQRFMLPDDLDEVLDHASRHWAAATGTPQTN
jgi:hypothetical protein